MGQFLRTGGYSSDVTIFLDVNHSKLEVASVGPDKLILRDRQYLAPCTSAEIIITVDGVEKRYPVTIDDGYAIENEFVHFSEGLIPF